MKVTNATDNNDFFIVKDKESKIIESQCTLILNFVAAVLILSFTPISSKFDVKGVFMGCLLLRRNNENLFQFKLTSN